MATVQITGPARIDLLAIRDYLHSSNPPAAEHYQALCSSAFDHLARFPRSERGREDLPRRGLRSWTVWPYVILYRVEDTTVQIVRVIHGARDLPNLE